ncbi:MAG TPA: FxsA family protein [Methylocella sp.]|nr:FxsA family protein [Methylocella sp.]
MLRLRGNDTRSSFVRLPILILFYLSLWLAAEFAAFVYVVYLIGWVGALSVCVLSSLAGLATLRRLGLSAALRLRRSIAARSKGQKFLSREVILDGTLAGVGAVLLILPGFVSDLLGLALAAPSFRIWVMERLQLLPSFQAHRRTPLLIELAPRDWSRQEGPGTVP